MDGAGAERVVRAYLDALGRGDLEAAGAYLADDVEAVDVPLGLTVRGRDAIIAALAERIRAFPDMTLDVRHVAASGEWVATEHVSAGTHEGPLTIPAGEVAPTGRRIETEMAEWFCVQEGRITLSRAYWDVSTALRQLGLA